MRPQPYSNTRVVILGSGSWGTALGIASSRRNQTMIWSRDPRQASSLSVEKQNVRYLPGITLPEELQIVSSLHRALSWLSQASAQKLLLLAVPVSGLREMCQVLSQQFHKPDCLHPLIIWTCKGFEERTAYLPHEIVEQSLHNDFSLGVLSGPSFAKEIAQGLPAALTIASKSAELCSAVTSALHQDVIRIYTSNDVVGVELGGALKNIIAIACGISDGLKLGSNARAAIIARGLAEAQRFGKALGVQKKTLFGLTGLGDLVLSSTSELSRNRQVGLDIGSGRAIEAILADDILVEGVYCARAALSRANEVGVELPIITTVCAILFDGMCPNVAISTLLTRKACFESM